MTEILPFISLYSWMAKKIGVVDYYPLKKSHLLLIVSREDHDVMTLALSQNVSLSYLF